MRGLLKITLSFLFLSFFFLAFTFSSFAQPQTAVPTELDPCAQQASPVAGEETLNEGGDLQFTTDVPLECIEEGKNININVTFHDLTPGEKYAMCTGHQNCLKEDGWNAIKSIGSLIAQDGKHFEAGIFATSSRLKIFTADDNGEITVKVCGDGSSKVKIEQNCADNSTKNYFWGGNIYFMSMGVFNEGEYVPVRGGGFYVSRSYPKVKINPSQNININNVLTVSVSQDFIRNGGDKRNNYQIVVKGGEGGRYYKEECLTINSQNTPTTKTFSGFSVGKYTIEINDQNEEGGGGFLGLSKDKCRGGFHYYQINCTITRQGDGDKTCKGVDAQGNAIARDPRGEEYKAFLKDLRALNKVSKSVMFPCGSGNIQVADPAKCTEIQTAIGTIKVTPQGFITSIFSFVLTLAAFGAIIIIIFSGYILMTSNANKEKIQGARETITAAVLGLLFIIFSIVILEILGVDILRIPGFTR